MVDEKRDHRVDSNGRAYAGSQQQIQFYVNDQPLVLNQAISDAFKTSLSALGNRITILLEIKRLVAFEWWTLQHERTL